MTSRTDFALTRRATLAGLGAFAGGFIGHAPGRAAAEPPSETTTVRLVGDLGLCQAPQFLAEEFLRLEGFTDIGFSRYDGAVNEIEVMLDGRADFASALGSDQAIAIDRGQPITVLGGLHVGCVEVFGGERVASFRDLAGKRVVINGLGGPEHNFVAAIIAFIGIDPRRDIDWVVEPDYTLWPDMLATGKVDALSAFPPFRLTIREMGIGHVILNTATDDPWRHYFCCMIAGHRDFVQRYPVATRRVMRAYARAQEFCANEPELAARNLVENGIYDRLDFALTTLREVPYSTWRDYDPADSLRFYALRLREAGLVTGSPNDIVARGLDTSFLEAIKREMKI